jgi:hypothetical protein
LRFFKAPAWAINRAVTNSVPEEDMGLLLDQDLTQTPVETGVNLAWGEVSEDPEPVRRQNLLDRRRD